MKFLSLILLVFASSAASAESLYPRRDLLTLKSSRPGLQVAIFKNSAAAQPRCMCATFSAIVREGQGINAGPVGTTSVEDIEIVTRTGRRVTSRVILKDTMSLFRCPGSPWYTEQSVQMVDTPKAIKNRSVEVRALAKKCLNPTEKECAKLVVVASEKFSLQDIFSLNETSPIEALELLKAEDKNKSSDCAGQ
jgi:hypothetical protein